MKISFKLFATLTDFLPTQDKYTNVVKLELAPDTTIGQVIELHHLPAKWVHLVLLNGAYVAPELRADQMLKDGDTLAIWPPIAGG
jgi:molybdopterin converting factor small subunit